MVRRSRTIRSCWQPSEFIVDAQLPPALAIWLVEQGHRADHGYALGLGAAPDAAIASRAEADNAVLVSKDADFLALRLPDRFAYLWLRCGNATTQALFAWLLPSWMAIERWLTSGERLVEVR